VGGLWLTGVTRRSCETRGVEPSVCFVLPRHEPCGPWTVDPQISTKKEKNSLCIALHALQNTVSPIVCLCTASDQESGYGL
jgi:hypothetical protein